VSSRIAPLLLPLLLILLQGSSLSADAPNPDEIDRAVRQLGDDNYLVRERASKFLWEAGKPAEAALRGAATSEDAEVALRAQRILVYFRYGVYPDTPPEKVALIAQFRYGNTSDKQAALIGLRDLQDLPRALALLRTEPDERLRKQLVGGLTKNLDRTLGQMFVANQWAEAGQLLELGAVDDAGMRNLAAYLLLRDQLDAKIASLQERLAGQPDPSDARLLAMLLRAKGDLPAAQRAAEKTDDADLVLGLLFEQANWKPLAEQYDRATGNDLATSSGDVVTLGYSAAHHRLAGNRQQFEKAADAIVKLAERKPNKRWYCGEALIINERIDQAVELLREHRPVEVFELLCRQGRFREALELAAENAELLAARLPCRVRTTHSDLFDQLDGAFGLIVANLPYVAAGEAASLPPEVGHDPPQALFGGGDGLAVIRRFVPQAAAHLAPGGWVAMEVGADQCEEVVGLCTAAGLVPARAASDLSGNPRFVFARNPPAA